ncbi:AraC family transcriptional regulator [Pseudomonas sp. NPDC088444]|uniref:AraC family transcriptional regulator n=1 Tax=Pseudomonas sp. NPDC088444 TaxID=3364456 RepID=UPI003850394F
MHKVKRPTMHAYLLSPYLEALERSGHNTQLLAARYGMQPSDVTTLTSRLPLSSFVAFTKEAAVLTGNPALGLHLGSELTTEQLGTLGVLMTVAPTLKNALESISEWISALQESTQSRLNPAQGGVAELIYRLEAASPDDARQDVEYTLATTCNLIRARMGKSWHPVQVHFEHGPSANLRLYERIFRCPVSFHRSLNRILISEEDLNRQPAREGSWRERAMLPMIEEHLRSFLHGPAEQDSFSKQVSLHVAQSLGNRPVTLVTTAQALKTSVRSLQRRLESENTSFREILQAQRKRKAETLLRGRGQSVLAVAGNSGYADATALSRAFKKWTGKSPRQFVKQGVEKLD